MSGIKAGILTASDRCSAGINKDLSGKTIEEIIRTRLDGEVCCYKIVPDEREIIANSLMDMADNLGVDLILTTGGTGFSKRDVTPEATMDVIEKVIPGMPEAMRRKSAEKAPNAMLSRAVAGIRGQTLIINLPGSPIAVEECLEVILPVLPHAIRILKGQINDCRDEQKCHEGHGHNHKEHGHDHSEHGHDHSEHEHNHKAIEHKHKEHEHK